MKKTGKIEVNWKQILRSGVLIGICIFAGVIDIQAAMKAQSWGWRIFFSGGSIAAILGIVFSFKLALRWGFKKGKRNIITISNR